MLHRELTPERITRLVLAQEIATENLRTRMEGDYARYLLEWTDGRWGNGGKPEKYRTYISNEPRTYADRMIALLVSADMIARVPYRDAKEPEREMGKAKERFFTWAVKTADEALRHQLMPSLKQQLAFYIALRGWFAGRALLYKAEDGTTKVDITLFDPLHTFYGVGSNGLKWVCHKLLKTREEIEDEYGVDVGGIDLPGESASGQGDLGLIVYDFYDATHSAVVVGNDFVKEPTPHGARRVPSFIGMVGANPFIQRKDELHTKDLMREVGESIYASDRGVYDALNQTLSDRLTLVGRMLDPGYILKSETGQKTLDENPYAEKSEVSLKIGESLDPIRLQEATRDTDLLLAQLTGEGQRGSFPHTAWGEIQFQLSGYAINTLRQGLDLKIQDSVLAMRSAFTQIAELLCEQYKTGGYAPVLSSGGVGKSYYREVIDPAVLASAEELEIELVPRLPKDDVTMYSMAQIAREGKTPLLSHRTALDSVLQLEDADGEIQMIREEQAEMASPLAALNMLIKTAEERGRYDLVAIYRMEQQALVSQMMGPPGGAVPPQAPDRAGAPGGLLPQVGPPRVTGFPQPAPGAPAAVPLAPVPPAGVPPNLNGNVG